MSNCLVLDDASLAPEVHERLSEIDGEWHVHFVESIEGRVGEASRVHPPDVVLFDGDLAPTRRAELTERVAEWEFPPALICIVPDGDADRAGEVLREGADAYLFASQLAGENADAVLEAALQQHELHHRDRQLRDRLEERSSELLGLNALANGISSSLDRETIVQRGLSVFAGICRRGGAALAELQPAPALIEDAPDASEELEGDEAVELVCTQTFSADGSTICEDLELDERWARVIYDDHLRVLDEPPSEGLPGLDAFWEAHPEGRLTILPLRGNRRPIGALVLGEFEEATDEVGLTREGLRAMAVQFGAALENARLFTEVKHAYESLREAQEKLVRTEKFASVGVLAAEIAHEINNPASFVISNLSVMQEYADSLSKFLDEVDRRAEEVSEDFARDIDALKETYEIEFLREDIEALLSRSTSGMQRIHQIVQDLRYLSRDSGGEPGWIELESLLDATVNLVSHEAKFRARLERDYRDVPQVMSDASRLSQVFLNLLVNAVQSLEVGDAEDDYIRIATEQRGDEVWISIEDSGEGIPEEMQSRIFEPFFTTKPTGEGTGLGLSISKDIVENLGGSIEVESTPGEGAIFRVRLPIRPEQFAEDDDLRDSGFYDTPPGLDDISDAIFEK